MIDALAQRLRRAAPERHHLARRVALRLTVPRLRVVLVVAAIAALLALSWLWLRDSSLVAVKRVTVSGASGPDAGAVRAALVSAARNMTTLDVRMEQLRSAVAPYPVVKDLRVSVKFPHGIAIHVVEPVRSKT